MEQTLLDRLMVSYQAERDHLHAQAGRFLTLALATLALIQFTLLEGGLYETNLPRFLDFVTAGLAIAWLLLAPIPLLIASRANREQGRWARIRSGWSNFNPMVLASYTLLFLGAVAADSSGARLDGVALGYLVMGGLLLDILGFSAMQIWKPHRVYFLLLLPRLLIAGTIAIHGSGLDPDTVTPGERALAVWPVIATSITALWFVWSFNAWLRGRSYMETLAGILRDFTDGRSSSQDAERRYENWVQAALHGHNPAKVRDGEENLSLRSDVSSRLRLPRRRR